MINLDQRPEKLEMSFNQLHPYGIFPYRFSAVNGWELTLAQILDVGVKLTPGMKEVYMSTIFYEENGQILTREEKNKVIGQTYFAHCFVQGPVGIALSHLSVLKDAYDAGYETIWVMEDDIEVIRDPRILSELIQKLDTLTHHNWDILFTDKDIRDANGKYIPCYGAAPRPNFTYPSPKMLEARTKISADFMRVGARFGAHSMILRRQGIEKILNFYAKYQIYLPYDMDYYLPQGIKLYSLLHDVVSNMPKALSDNGHPTYLQKKP
jgi:GR25 family glycosyltransferase involved in LPS biosynthesis